MAEYEAPLKIVDTYANLPTPGMDGWTAFAQDVGKQYVYAGGSWMEVGSGSATAGPAVSVVKNSSTSRTSTTTYAADPDLTFNVEAGGSYAMTGVLRFELETSPYSQGYKIKFDGSAALSTYLVTTEVTYFTAPTTYPKSAAFTTFGTTGLTYSGIQFTHILVNGGFTCSSSGTVALYWAQNSSSGNYTKLVGGSNLLLIRSLGL